MRTLLFTEKVTYEDGTTGPIDISKCRLDLKEICFAKARKCDELSFKDNPYAEGGERFDWDHNTGNPKTRQNLSRNTSFNSNQSTSTQRNYNNNNNLNSNQINSQFNNSSSNYQKPQNDGKKRKGYLGGNFDPNYVRKGKQPETSNNTNKSLTGSFSFRIVHSIPLIVS
ncbi:uncharacterized protein MELLADRAFT_69981 [Melampsora larici-populina 98AG31]|uniref:Uncharacterized protein n=1 Tax=Melampsora larici-populina (strain 98AG31 / pathotype 3-4-7) TaxID=747676 RepID=F4SD15_MELLP|nr:uncharacterized protein MELLADRAFT_69981 [Melampsora larici-populina 98AG31]EGF97463.1 hypothetical protein MELLADRAFT_69981 [Melampsora larici-populina 98AG31]